MYFSHQSFHFIYFVCNIFEIFIAHDCMPIIVIISWCIDTFVIIKCSLLSVVSFFVLKSNLSDIIVATQLFYSTWCMYFLPSIFDIYFWLLRVSPTEGILLNLCHLTRLFNVMIDISEFIFAIYHFIISGFLSHFYCFLKIQWMFSSVTF